MRVKSDKETNKTNAKANKQFDDAMCDLFANERQTAKNKFYLF